MSVDSTQSHSLATSKKLVPTSLSSSIQYIPGVGPFKAQILSKINITTIYDLLMYFPRDHQDRRKMLIRDVQQGRKLAIAGKILFAEIKRLGRNLGQARAIIKDESGQIEVIWFKRLSYKFDVFSALKKDLQIGNQIHLFGQVVVSRNALAIRVENYDLQTGDLIPSTHSGGIVPIYALTDGLGEKWFRELLARIVPAHVNQISDPLPEEFIKGENLISLSDAIMQYHFPSHWKERDQARERLAFDEFFFLELALHLNRQNRDALAKGFQSIPNKKLLTPFKTKLDYRFTAAQSRCINEIFRDMGHSKPMNRLLQGDVGSGKTVVALSAALLAIENKRQVTFLAPTEILAEQHALSIKKIFENLNVTVACLTGSTPTRERKITLQKLKEGRIDLLIGTHAILNKDVSFKNLGLVIIDEQHRFGVRQRARLINKSTHSPSGTNLDLYNPDVLIMTATPIPRTLALTLYGDLDTSVIDELPSGRKPIQTRQTSESEALNEIKKTLNKNHQAFVVLPLIDESETLTKKAGKSFKAAKIEFEKLKKYYSDVPIALLHGQMSSAEKNKIMTEFRSGETKILVATPVIEVGIDVPNSTLVVIMSPERFGLSQLHQLRGRVGRARYDSQCLLVTEGDVGSAEIRLQTFCSVADGFRLAEEDLKLRGPGEFLGEAQHGIPFFKVGNLVLDALLISHARQASRKVVEGEVSMTMKQFQLINFELHKKFGNKLKLSMIG